VAVIEQPSTKLMSNFNKPFVLDTAVDVDSEQELATLKVAEGDTL